MKTNMLRLLLMVGCMVGVVGTLNSCAYTQFNKQITEKATVYNGFAVELPLSLYSSQGGWYVKVRKLEIQKIKPFVHDSIMLTDTSKEALGTPKPFSHYTEYQYIKISDGTAAVLQRTDGYATLETLCDELKAGYAHGCVSELPDSMQHRVYAQIKTEQGNVAYVSADGQPIRKPGMGTKVLSKVALVCVDVPGTVIYNVSMPIMAPFIFFKDFLSNNDSLNNINR